MRFHIVLLHATRNRALEGFGVMLQEFFHQVRGDVLARSGQVQKSLADHRAIVDAIRRRDAAAAQEVMRRHLGVYDAYPFAPSEIEAGHDSAGPAER
jgi:DNA-binding FadR family transcriptional regulator